jgi:hypothetical protein
MSTAPAEPGPAGAEPLAGSLHLFVAFDWGEEIDLDHARRLAPGAVIDLPRRPRTPSSFAYKPSPLRFPLRPLSLQLPPLGDAPPQPAVATIFDFAAVSVGLRWPFRLPPASLAAAAGRLTDPATAAAVVRAAREAVTPLHDTLLPAIRNDLWQDNLWEEYYVFQLTPGGPWQPEALLGPLAGWLAGLVRLDDQPLSDGEVQEALRLALCYGRHDLFVPDWAAAVLLDQEQECHETLQAVEFANLQLLEYRHIDNRLDDVVAQAYRLLEHAARRRRPLWRNPGQALRVLGELKVEANGLFERTGNVLKLIGDQYLARVYRLLATRFHLREWGNSIERKLDALGGVYQVISDQGTTFRTELLEVVVILLIAVEVVLAIWRR